MDRLDALEQRVAELENALRRERDRELLRSLTRQPSAPKDSVIPWWRSQWEEGV